ncbi:MAG: FAD-dependent oxidoreductase [Geminicoccaceae bacterium]|nr:FAD-dependent oxidoreductase [Geminicoccaceae bacterium]
MLAEYPFRASPDQQAGGAAHHPVVVVGAGPVGLAVAIDLRLRGIAAVLLEAGTAVSTGSRAICYAKRSLEILDRLGIGQRMLDKGVTWRQGKVFWRERMVYEFDLLPEAGHRMPAFVNCQQYYLEQYLIERAQELGIDLRFGHRVTGVVPEAGGVRIAIATPAGDYGLTCDWLLACDGARSTVRRALGLGFEGQVFKDKFLITDIRMEADFPPERWFWFDPPFHPGQSALLHSQPDKIWRIDLQLGWQADAEEEAKPERVVPRLRAMLGKDRRFELEWISVYTFRCRRLARFRHGRVMFLGDAAHEVSPFGARRQPRLEARLRAAGPGTRAPARQLRRGAPRRGRRQHPPLDPLDRVHHAQERGEPRLSRCRAGARRAPSVRPPDAQQRPAVDADPARLLGPQHARPGGLRRRARAGVAGRGRPASPGRCALLAHRAADRAAA